MDPDKILMRLVGLIPIIALIYVFLLAPMMYPDPMTIGGVKFNVPNGFEPPEKTPSSPDKWGSIYIKHETYDYYNIKIEVLVGDHSDDSVKKEYSRNATEYVKDRWRHEKYEEIEISGITFYKKEKFLKYKEDDVVDTEYIFTYNNQIFQITINSDLNHETLLKEMLGI